MSRRKNHKFPGEDLIDALCERAHKVGIDSYELAEILGISHSYLAKFLRGQEPIACVSEKILHRMADFLETNLVHVLLLAGRLKPADFVRDNEQQIETAFRNRIRSDAKPPGMAITGTEKKRMGRTLG